MNTTYSLGASKSEQKRLFSQREIYGDTFDIEFDVTDHVAEFGCGAGANLWIAQQLTKGRYIGLDIQSSQVEAARNASEQLALNNVEFQVEDATKTTLPDSSLDAAFLRFVLIHQPDPLPILREMIRTVRTGGRLVINEPYDQTYYVGPNKDNLLHCFRVRNHLAYGEGRGSPNVAVNLFSLFSKLPVNDIQIHPHVIHTSAAEPERCSSFLKNLLGLVEPSAELLISAGLITTDSWELAQKEAQAPYDDTFLTQTIWKAECIVE